MDCGGLSFSHTAMQLLSDRWEWLWNGYGTVPGGRWTIDTEGGHVVVSVSLIRNGYEYGTVPHLRGTIHTESGHVVNSVS